MNRDSFKIKVGLAFVISHFLILVWTLTCSFLGGFKFPELTTTIGLLLPLFATYTSAIIRDIIRNAENHKKSNRTVNKPFQIITMFIIGLFFFYLFMIITLKAFNYGFQDFEQFKILLGISEAVFGAYIAQIIFSMYERVGTQAGQAAQTGSPEPAITVGKK